VVAGESGEVGNPSTLGMTNRRGWWVEGERLLNRNIFILLGGPQVSRGEAGLRSVDRMLITAT
jgi:hypothetical protein